MLPPRAYTFMGLNAVRALSIIALLLVFASNIVTLANDVKAVNHFLATGKNENVTATAGNATTTNPIDMDYIMGSTVPNQPAGAFWAVLNRLFIIFQTVILILSEVGFPAIFFERYFPVLGKTFGLGALGLIQMLIGAAILSHHVDTFTLVSAFFLFSVGCVNTLAGLIFRASAKPKRSVTSWREHAKAALPTHIGGVKIPPFSPSGATPTFSPPSFVSHLYTGSTVVGSNQEHSGEWKEEKKMAGFGFGRQGEKAAAANGFLISKPVESLPRYVPKPSGNAF
ncbi:hypothetical protein BDN70DRAFT_912141 [Pholiota conissans]|uniref:DUF7598 domain-containing protein n=1 Tax=Pholiota conissans TaxID=109636 RepID=A0A9P6CVD0_9AGAR|nr:hypothetical protein BDN70DRAFT_912141 [Pholiota conissans]